jgi:hypothetical protein
MMTTPAMCSLALHLLMLQQFNRGLFDYLIATDAAAVPKQQQPATEDAEGGKEQPAAAAVKGKQPGSRKRRTPSDERDAEFSVTRCRSYACYNIPNACVCTHQRAADACSSVTAPAQNRATDKMYAGAQGADTHTHSLRHSGPRPQSHMCEIVLPKRMPRW